MGNDTNQTAADSLKAILQGDVQIGESIIKGNKFSNKFLEIIVKLFREDGKKDKDILDLLIKLDKQIEENKITQKGLIGLSKKTKDELNTLLN